MGDVLVCRVQEVIRTLIELGLPEELSRDLVYKWKVVEHPAAMALRTDPWLGWVREQYTRHADDWMSPDETCCVCPRNYTHKEVFVWGKEHNHKDVVPRIWSLISPRSRIWLERIHGPPKRAMTTTTVRCPRAVLCMRYFRHTMPLADTQTEFVQETSAGCFTVDSVTNEDNSLAFWLRTAPSHVLEEYLRGVTGWSKRKLAQQLNVRFGGWFVDRNDLARLCLEH